MIPCTMKRMDPDGHEHQWLDEFSQLWSLRRTGDRTMPFIMLLLEKNVQPSLEPEAALHAGTTPAAPPPPDEKGFVIEKHVNSGLIYWSGRGTTGKPEQCWSPKHEDAIRFCRAQDAAFVLAWQLNGDGRVVEHLWSMAAPRADKETP